MHTFRKCVEQYSGNRYVKSFNCFDQFLCMAFDQLTHRESLRDIQIWKNKTRCRNTQFFHCRYVRHEFQSLDTIFIVNLKLYKKLLTKIVTAYQDTIQGFLNNNIDIYYQCYTEYLLIYLHTKVLFCFKTLAPAVHVFTRYPSI